MIPLSRNENGKYVQASSAPQPHRMAKAVQKTGNYGLADQARTQHKYLVESVVMNPEAVVEAMVEAEKKEDEERILFPVPGAVNFGRGRGRFLQQPKAKEGIQPPQQQKTSSFAAEMKMTVTDKTLPLKTNVMLSAGMGSLDPAKRNCLYFIFIVVYLYSNCCHDA